MNIKEHDTVGSWGNVAGSRGNKPGDGSLSNQLKPIRLKPTALNRGAQVETEGSSGFSGSRFSGKGSPDTCHSPTAPENGGKFGIPLLRTWSVEKRRKCKRKRRSRMNFGQVEAFGSFWCYLARSSFQKSIQFSSSKRSLAECGDFWSLQESEQSYLQDARAPIISITSYSISFPFRTTSRLGRRNEAHFRLTSFYNIRIHQNLIHLVFDKRI